MIRSNSIKFFLPIDFTKGKNAQGNILITPGFQSTSSDIKASFDRNTKITIGAAEGLDVSSLFGYNSEKEIILKPFISIQLLYRKDLNKSQIDNLIKLGFTEKKDEDHFLEYR